LGNYIYHYYLRKEPARNSSDHKQWYKLEKVSSQRVLHLVCTEVSGGIELESCFHLREQRDLQSYETFSCVNFKELTFTNEASLG